jgi:hypothetical protein
MDLKCVAALVMGGDGGLGGARVRQIHFNPLIHTRWQI